MKTIATLTALVALSVAPALGDPVPSAMQAKLAPMIRSSLLDPDSARITFQSYRRAKDGWVVCGMVNAHNTFGGYTGNKPFYFVATTMQGPILGGVEDEEQGMLIAREVCAQ